MEAIAPTTLTTLEAIFAQEDPDVLFQALMAELCVALDCDRCFLYLRDPQLCWGRITHCHCRGPKCEDMTGAVWINDDQVGNIDPLMAIAFRTPEAVFVDDIETAGADLINREYEQQQFGHRALIHAPIYYQGDFMGVVEPCTFDQPHSWTTSDRQVIAWIQERLSDRVMQYLEAYPLE